MQSTGAKARFAAPLAKRHPKLVTLSVIMANPPHLDQAPSTRPAPAWGRKTATPARLSPALDPLLLSRWFACFRQRGWLTRGPNWVQREQQRGDGAGTGWGTRRALCLQARRLETLLGPRCTQKSPSPHGAPTALQGQKHGPERPQSPHCEAEFREATVTQSSPQDGRHRA